MPRLGEMSKPGNSSEQIVNLIYNTGYRLTGSHRKTQELIKDVFNALNGNINSNAALKSLCLIYINKPTSSLSKNLSKTKSSPPTKDNSSNSVQNALLMLPPTERLVLVLREIVGLDYVKIAEMTGMEKTAVTLLLNTGRRELRNQLAPPSGQGKLPEKYFAAK